MAGKFRELTEPSKFREPSSSRYLSPLTHDEKTLEALIKMEVACRLALESLPTLPTDTEEALREHIETLCEVTERELNRLKPGYSRPEAPD
jgi:hypothetical protein